MTRWISIVSSIVAFLAILAFLTPDVRPTAGSQLHSAASFSSRAFAQLLRLTGHDAQPLPIADTVDTWNIIEHLGGNSPWIPKRHGIVDEGLEPPEGCFVDQVHMVNIFQSLDSIRYE